MWTFSSADLMDPRSAAVKRHQVAPITRPGGTSRLRSTRLRDLCHILNGRWVSFENLDCWLIPGRRPCLELATPAKYRSEDAPEATSESASAKLSTPNPRAGKSAKHRSKDPA